MVNGNLPPGWVLTTLGQIRKADRKTIEPAKTPEQAFELYSVPIFNTGRPEIVFGKEIGSNKQYVEKETVLICKINPRINRVWVVGDFSEYPKIASTEWIPFKKVEGILPLFLSYYMQTSDFRDYLAQNVSGVGGSLMRARTNALEEYPFLYPPLPEQERIVARIESLFTQLEAGVAALKRAQAALKRYKASVLKAACEGRLVAQEAGDESAEVMLRRILAEKGEVYRAPEGEMGELPRGWVWARIEQLAKNEKHSLAIGPFGSDLKVSDYRERGVPLVFVRNIRGGSFDNTHYITIEKATSLAAHKVSGGDILITKMGEPPGDVCIYPLTRPDAIITADCIRWRISPILENRFFAHIINSQLMQKQIQQITRGVAQKKVSLQRFKNLAIPLPPVNEQHLIFAEVERRLSVVQELEGTIEANLRRAGRLRQAVLKRAFEGRLVEQI